MLNGDLEAGANQRRRVRHHNAQRALMVKERNTDARTGRTLPR
jgi:hypothetical protein